MKQKVILFGITEFEKRLKYYIENYTDDSVVAFCVDKKYLNRTEYCNCPVVALEELSDKYSAAKYSVLVGIGYKEMNDLRAKKTEEILRMNYRLYNFIHPTAFIDKTAILGMGNIVLGNVFVDYGVEIGTGNILESGTIIAHETQIGDYNYISPGVVCGGKVQIENRCFIGLNATLRSAIKIKQYSLIGAGCYMDRSSEESSVYVPQRNVKLEKGSKDIKILYKGE